MIARTSILLNTPDAALAALSLCGNTPAELSEWIATLPLADTRQTAQLIDEMARELACLAVPFADRLALLEIVRPTLHYICTRLDRTLQGAQVSAESQARLAQRLQINLCVGYKTVLRDAQREIENDPTIVKDTIPLACHRTLADMSRTLLRSLQLYVVPGDSRWLELNQLYLLAESLGLTGATIADPEDHQNAELTIEQTYLRSVLLYTARPNQLRPVHLTQLFNALEAWVRLVCVEPPSNRTLFVVDLDTDTPPRLRKLSAPDGNLRGIRCDVLVYELEAYVKHIDTDILVPDQLDTALVRHLVNAWGTITQRSFSRTPTDGVLKMCVGMRSIHFFLSGGVETGQAGAGEDPPGKEFDPFIGESTPENDNPALKIYDVRVLDAGPNSYRIDWPDGPSGQLQSGELLAVRAEADPRWCIGVVRWLRHQDSGVTMGLELLAPRAIAVSVRGIRNKRARVDFARALLLPEVKAIGQPATLITLPMPSEGSQKVHLQRQGVQTTAQLTGCVQNTESFTQFTFRMLDGYLENAQIDIKMNALWDTDAEKP